MKLPEGTYLGASRRMVDREGLRLTLSTYEPGQRQPWHTHEHPTLYISLRGGHLDALPNGPVQQPLLSLVFHPAHVSHRSEVGPQGMAGLNVELEPSWLERHDLSERDLGSERLLSEPELCTAAVRLAIFGRDDTEVDSWVLEIVGLLPHSVEEARIPRWLLRARARIQEEVTHLTGVAQLAGDIGVHPGHLVRTFRRHYGTTVTAAIQAARRAHACRKIMEGMSAGEAAAEAGFADQFHFSRSLQADGMRPVQLKNLRDALC